MKFTVLLAASALVLLPRWAAADGVAVGSSSLISTVQYSDSFTIGTDSSTGTRNGTSYTVGGYPISSQQAIVESAYAASQTSPTFQTTAFSLNNDAHYVDVTTNGAPFFQTYPGSSHAGSNSGFTQTGLGHDTSETAGAVTIYNEEDHGFAYGLGNNFIVQADAVQTNDRIDIYIGDTTDTILSSDGLSVFFRASGGGGTIRLFNAGVGETDTSFASTNVLADQWNNYAVGFDLTTKTLSIYTNQVLDGTIDLATFDGGAYASVLDANSADYVGVGGHVITTGDQIGLLWTDNFQVGLSEVPEPSTHGMMAAGVAILLGLRRLRRA